MLPNPNVLATNLLSMPNTDIPLIGMTNFANVIATYMNQVQAGPTGTPGIFTLNIPVFIAALVPLPPVPDNSWIERFANAWAAAVTASVITPGTVTNAEWLGSGDLDTETSPSAASTITTIAAAQAQLASDLQYALSTNNPPYPFAQAIYDAIIKFIFLCIGLGPPPTYTPTPIPLNAE